MEAVIAVEISPNGTASSIIINEHGILLRCIEMGRQIVATIDGVAALRLEIPFAKLTQLYVLQTRGIEILEKRFLAILQIYRPAAVGGGVSLPAVDEGGRIVGDIETEHEALAQLQHLTAAILGIDAENVLVVAVLGEGVDHAVGAAPLPVDDTRVEVGSEAAHLFRGYIHGIELVLYHAGRHALGHSIAYAVEGFWRTAEHDCLAVGAPLPHADKAIVGKQGVRLHALQVENHSGHESEGTAGDVVLADEEQHLGLIGT